MVIIDTKNFKGCNWCGEYVVPHGSKGLCKECIHYKFLYRNLNKDYEYYRYIPGKHLRRGGYDDIVGCSQQEFRDYIEGRFENWMNWNNKSGFRESNIKKKTIWELDHVIPWVSAKTDKEKLKLSHYTNFQPLCSYENRYIKSGKIR